MVWQVMSDIPNWRQLPPHERMTLVSRHLPLPVSLLLLVAIGYHVVRIAVGLMPAPHQAWEPPTDAQGAAGPPPARTADYATIAKAHLFGIAADADDLPVADAAAPPTTLSLELRGLVVSDDAAIAHAIIGDGSGGENVYFLQSEVPGGATVIGIQANRVILRRAGVVEALDLPRLANSSADGSRAFPVSGGMASAGSPSAIPEAGVQTRVARLADIMMPRPRIAGGRFQGVEVYPGERGEDFAALGLKPGDVVTAIDGRPLSASDAAAPFQGIAESATLTLTISRRGQTRTIKLDMGKLVAPAASET